jgi:hypothetical protein
VYVPHVKTVVCTAVSDSALMHYVIYEWPYMSHILRL